MSDIILTDANFDAEVLKATLPVLVDFGRRGVDPAGYRDRLWKRWLSPWRGRRKWGKSM